MANRLLKSIKFPDLTDTYIVGDTSLSVAGAGADAKTTGDALQTKAEADGYYSNLTAGSAEQLLSTVTIEDEVPYLFRTSGGSVDIGDREYINGIVGGTVAWNQLLPNFTTSAWATSQYATISNGEVAVAPTSTWVGTQTHNDVSVVSGHKYLISVVGRLASSGTNVEIGTGLIGNTTTIGTLTTTTNTALATIVNVVNAGSGHLNIANGVGVANYYVSKPQLFDLTQMFGSTIADYIYSLETATAGAGVAFFRKLFPKPYYAYNAGELLSVSGVSAHNMTGFNQFDKSTAESGKWFNNEQGAITNVTGYSLSDYIKILPNTTYYCTPTGSVRSLYFDADKNLVNAGTWANIAVNGGTFTTPSGVAYVRCSIQDSKIDDFCINISWDGSRNGEYEPYIKHSYPLDDSLTLRGIPKLDSSNNLYYDGDTYESDGTVTRKYGIVDLGTLNWNYNGGQSAMVSTDLASLFGNGVKIKCAKYETTNRLSNGGANPFSGQDKVIGVNREDTVTTGNFAPNVLVVKDTAYTSSSDFKTAMSGVYLVYELKTPTTETADPYQQTQIVDDFGTEEYVTTSIIPVGHKTQYMPNLRAKLEMAPNSPNGNGDYIVRQTNGMNEYVPLVIEDTLPTIPSTAGSYKLTVTVTEGSDPVLSWEAE